MILSSLFIAKADATSTKLSCSLFKKHSLDKRLYFEYLLPAIKPYGNLADTLLQASRYLSVTIRSLLGFNIRE